MSASMYIISQMVHETLIYIVILGGACFTSCYIYTSGVTSCFKSGLINRCFYFIVCFTILNIHSYTLIQQLFIEPLLL